MALRNYQAEDASDAGIDPQVEKAKESLALAKRLLKDAQEAARPHKKNFRQNFEYLLGINGHHKVPITQAARELQSWSSQTTRNWLFALVNNKSGKIKESEPKITVEDLDEVTDYLGRLTIRSQIEHELTRLRWMRVREDVYLWGSAAGLGVSMTSLRPDPNLPEEIDPMDPEARNMLVSLRAIDPGDISIDPSVDDIHDPDCRYVCWDPLMDLSKVFEMWPDVASKLKPESPKMDVRASGGIWDAVTYKPQTNDDNLIYGSSGTYLAQPQGKLALRKAKVCFIWIRNESIVTEIEQTVIKAASIGYYCPACNLTYDEPTDTCAACGGGTAEVRTPATMDESRRIRRAYPFGRLIVYSGDTLLFDGDNPYQLEEVFPFQTYYHYRVPGYPYGFGDVPLLKPIQDAADLSISQLQDYCILAVYGLMEYPMGAKAYSKLGNVPRQTYPVPDHLAGKARIISPTDFNTPAWEALDRTLFREMEIVGQLQDTAGPPFGQAPISATESNAIQSALSAGMRGHMDRLNQWDSDVANAVLQLGKQCYGEKAAPMTMPDGTKKTVHADWSQFQNVRIRVSASIKEANEDKNIGQNIVALIGQGLIDKEDMDIALPKLGFTKQDIDEMNDRKQIRQEAGVMAAPPQEPPQGGGLDAQLQSQ